MFLPKIFQIPQMFGQKNIQMSLIHHVLLWEAMG